MDYLKEERKRGEVVKCAQCGKSIWSKWFSNEHRKRGQPYKETIMTFCGPCFFGGKHD